VTGGDVAASGSKDLWLCRIHCSRCILHCIVSWFQWAVDRFCRLRTQHKPRKRRNRNCVDIRCLRSGRGEADTSPQTVRRCRRRRFRRNSARWRSSGVRSRNPLWRRRRRLHPPRSAASIPVGPWTTPVKSAAMRGGCCRSLRSRDWRAFLG